MKNFYNTVLSRLSGLEKQNQRIVNFLIQNQHIQLERGELESVIANNRLAIRTPISDMFDRIVDSGSLGSYYSIFIEGKESTPELLTTPAITIDLKQMNENDKLSSLPKLQSKIVLNTTQYLRRERYTGRISVTSLEGLQQEYVRGLLVGSYFDAEMWLQPALASYLIKTHSIVVSSMISKVYNLSFLEETKLRALFALYMSQRLSGNDNVRAPRLYLNTDFIGSNNELKNMSEQVYQIVADMVPPAANAPLDIATTAAIIPKLVDTIKLREFNIATLFKICGNLGTNIISSQLALEYPPYWLYILIGSMSGMKVPLLFQLRFHKLDVEGKTKFLSDLLMNKALYNFNR